LAEIDRHWKAFLTVDKKTWLSSEDKRVLRHQLETSAQRVRVAVQTLDQQQGLGADLRYFRSKLDVAATLAEADLKTTRAN
jgi:hypothetical protein